MKSKLVLSLVALSVCIILASDYGFGQKLYPVERVRWRRRRPSPYLPDKSGIPRFQSAPYFCC
jgi:hypothetical protein